MQATSVTHKGMIDFEEFRGVKSTQTENYHFFRLPMLSTNEFFSEEVSHVREATCLHAKFLTREVMGLNEQSCFNLKVSASVKHINEQVRHSRAFKSFSKTFTPWSPL